MSHNIPADAPDDRNLLAVPPSERDHRGGLLTAQTVLVEYGDYQCPQCKKFHALMKAVQSHLNEAVAEENYLCFVFRHFPQPQHPQAQKAAAATEAAGAQGQFWQMHEILLEHQELGDGYLAEYASNLGLDVTQFLRDIARGVHLGHINQDIESGKRNEVDSTPALFINQVRYRNALEFEPLLTAIVESSNPL